MTQSDVCGNVSVVRRHLLSFLNAEGIDFQVLQSLALQSIKDSLPRWNELIEDADRSDLSAIRRKLMLPEYLESLDDVLVHKLLRQIIGTHLPLERLLTTLRCIFMERVESKEWEPTPGHIRFMISLACQCYNNEYIYSLTSTEEEMVARLERSLKEESVAPPGLMKDLIVYAMYFPLWTLNANNRLLQMADQQKLPDFSELITRQIREKVEEEREEIHTFGLSGDSVSNAVKQQYEESPYPRWLNLTRKKPVNFADKMAKNYPFLGDLKTNRPVRILIAGCGTGSHPIKVATKYSDAEVLAFDLSKASLAYGIRQSRRYGIKNIEFVHGDILRVDKLGERFDVIEAAGVLHHMQEPAAGLHALAQVLKPGGFLNIGLYSRRARHRILNSARNLVVGKYTYPTPKVLRTLRQEMILQIPLDGLGPTQCQDFFFLSGFRDLLFHAHEVEFTPLELKAMLDKVKLSFLGYRGIDIELKKSYRDRYPQDPYMRNLELLDMFEAEHPNLFHGLAMAWLRKDIE